MIILALRDAKRYENLIKQIETKEIKSLKDAKKALKLKKSRYLL